MRSRPGGRMFRIGSRSVAIQGPPSRPLGRRADPQRHRLRRHPRAGCSRCPISAFTAPIRVFTMPDPGVHDVPIRAFTMSRSGCSRCRDFRTVSPWADARGEGVQLVRAGFRRDHPFLAGPRIVGEGHGAVCRVAKFLQAVGGLRQLLTDRIEVESRSLAVSLFALLDQELGERFAVGIFGQQRFGARRCRGRGDRRRIRRWLGQSRRWRGRRYGSVIVVVRRRSCECDHYCDANSASKQEKSGARFLRVGHFGRMLPTRYRDRTRRATRPCAYMKARAMRLGAGFFQKEFIAHGVTHPS